MQNKEVQFKKFDKGPGPVYQLQNDIRCPDFSIDAGTRMSSKEWQDRFGLTVPSENDPDEIWFKLVVERTCSRCMAFIKNDWEENMCNGDISMQCSSQSHIKLWGDDSEKMRDHPALISNNAQLIQLSWGLNKPYKLCWNCHSDLIKTIGDFFKHQIKK